jgi:micrococcal nuclease
MARNVGYIVLFCWALARTASAALPATVVQVEDGDTLTVVMDGQPVTIDLSDVDAPEGADAFAKRARQSLSELCEHRQVLLHDIEVGKPRRSSAHVRCDGIEASNEQVRRGMARVVTSDLPVGSPLPQLQAEAQAARRGLWAGDVSPAQP